MIKICNKCGGTIADDIEDYDPFFGCECPFTDIGDPDEGTDEEPEECIY